MPASVGGGKKANEEKVSHQDEKTPSRGKDRRIQRTELGILLAFAKFRQLSRTGERRMQTTEGILAPEQRKTAGL